MKLVNVSKLTSATTVDDGNDIPNVFDLKKAKAKNRIPSIKKGVYGGVGGYGGYSILPALMGLNSADGDGGEGGGDGGGG